MIFIEDETLKLSLQTFEAVRIVFKGLVCLSTKQLIFISNPDFFNQGS